MRSKAIDGREAGEISIRTLSNTCVWGNKGRLRRGERERWPEKVLAEPGRCVVGEARVAAYQGEIINSNACEETNQGLAGLSTKTLPMNAARTVSVSNENGKQMSECWGIGQVDLVALFFPRTTGKIQ